MPVLRPRGAVHGSPSNRSGRLRRMSRDTTSTKGAGMRKSIIGAIAVTALAAAALTAAVVGTGPDTGAAADHVDAPGLTPPGGNFQLDVTDVYAWRAKTGNTVLAVNVQRSHQEGAEARLREWCPVGRHDEGRRVLAAGRQQRRRRLRRRPEGRVHEAEREGRSGHEGEPERQAARERQDVTGNAVTINGSKGVKAYAGSARTRSSSTSPDTWTSWLRSTPTRPTTPSRSSAARALGLTSSRASTSRRS